MDVVISQPMYFPWLGLLEQLKLADVFIFFDDVYYARGFYNRVQVKTPGGVKWLTVPIRGARRNVPINQVLIEPMSCWGQLHLQKLHHSYARSPCREAMLHLVENVMTNDFTNLSEISSSTIVSLANYFGFDDSTQFYYASRWALESASSQRLLDICKSVGAKRYITGHGARNYLDHGLFEMAGIEVRYMQYSMSPYPQLHGEFTPYVSALDAIANCGKEARSLVKPTTVNWREFNHGSN